MNIDVRPEVRPGLLHLPLPLLALPMGLGGLGLAWRQAGLTLGLPDLIGEAVLGLTALVWLAVVALHLLRAIRYPAALASDLRHPVRVAFAAAPTIGLMILGAAAYPHAPVLGATLWCIGVPLHLLVAMLLLRHVMAGKAEPAMLAPPLLIPFVGNLLAPALGARMGFVDASWMMFGVGFLLWFALLPLLLHRLIAGPKLPPPLLPSLAILLAPPAVGALAVVALTGANGGVSLALTGLAVLFAAVLLSLVTEFARVPFSLVWWSFTFPSAAFTVLVMVEDFHPLLCFAALAVATAITAYVAWRTALAALAGEFLRPGH